MDITTLYERVISSSNLDEDAKASEMLWLHTPLLTVEVRVRISPEAPNFIYGGRGVVALHERL